MSASIRVAAALATLATVFAGALAQEACIAEATQCTCSEQVSSQCTKSQGDGTCLLGMCDPSYRCDCLGFEKCSIRKCGGFAASPGATPSETVPFACDPNTGKNECRDMVEVVETLESANNARDAVDMYVDNVIEEEETASKDVEEVLEEKKEVVQAVREVEKLEANVPVAELQQIEEDLEKVQEEAALTAALTKEVAELSEQVFRGMRSCKRARREAREIEKEIVTLRGRLSKAKPEEEAGIKAEISVKEGNRRAACGRAARAAQTTRATRRACGQRRVQVRAARSRCNAARASCVRRCGVARERYGRR